MEKLENAIGKMMELMKAIPEEGQFDENVKEEAADRVVNVVNVMRIPSRDTYSYGLHLMDMQQYGAWET